MRIAIITSSACLAGGVERFVEQSAKLLLRRGHTLSIWYETEEPRHRPRLAVGSGVEWRQLDAPTAVHTVASWSPNVLLAHGLDDRVLEQAIVTTAPTVFVVHNYDGACVSGTKTWSAPRLLPCDRTLGRGCLLHYYPHRCGGLNPLTASRLYKRATLRRATLAACSRLAVLSQHMRCECVKHGIDPAKVTVIPPPAGPGTPLERTAFGTANRAFRLVFLGRLEAAKGVYLLLDALPLAAHSLRRPLCLTIAGDGRDLAALRDAAARCCRADARLEVRFTGWLDGDARDRLFDHSDLFVFPSVWPEPFGLSGLEAASRGLPAVAFDTGGVREWLHPGATGMLAPADPPTAHGLAAAITGCLENPARTRQMGLHARQMAAGFTAERHVASLEQVLSAAAGAATLAPVMRTASAGR